MYSIVIYVPKDMKESDFPKYAEEQGFKCFRLTQIGYQDLNKYLISSGEYDSYKDYLEKIALSLEYIGHPDFVLLANGQATFCEFKSATDSLSLAQIKFIDSFFYIKTCLAIAIDKDMVKLDSLDILKCKEGGSKDYTHLF